MRLPAVLLPLALVGCFFTGEADSGADSAAPAAPPQIDLLLVIDTSGSMKEESSAVLLGASEVIDALGDSDWRIGVMTTSADYGHGLTPGIDPGEAGTLAGDPVTAGTGADDALRAILACNTIYWKDSDLLSDPSYAAAADGSCPLPAGDEVPREYLECVCPAGWNESEGAGTEEGLEVVAAALCERGGEVPEGCFDAESSITSAQAEANADFWRADALPRAVIISDEGDGSRRVPSADDDAGLYLDLLDWLSADFRLYVLGPAFDGSDGSCLDGAQTWGVERYQNAASETGGAYAELRDPANGCASNDVAAAMAELLADAALP
ncbi:hypothetical protein LBMAG42_18800 [Deltaproteobacteria bacterium]|nr:hypothetical protein LBMAG42_18800 [Deltaproteobacteria bacterium]